MTFLLVLFVFVFGTIIGSFLNVVSLRFNTGRGINGRSACFVCRTPLVWYELVPVLSFIVQKGKCNTCQAKISKQYPLVEGVVGILFVLIALVETRYFVEITQATLLSMFFYWLIASVLTVIVIYDLKHKIIPDSLSFAFGFLSLLRIIILFQGDLIHGHVFDLLAGPILFAPFYVMWFISNGTWMGLGDAKLAVGIGFLLGFAGGVSAIILGFWIGSLIMIVMLVSQHVYHHGKRMISGKGAGEGLTLKSEVPFAPFLVLGVLFVYLFHFDFFSLNALLTMTQ